MRGIEEREESQSINPYNIFINIIEENFPKMKKDMPIKVQETTEQKVYQIIKESPHIT